MTIIFSSRRDAAHRLASALVVHFYAVAQFYSEFRQVEDEEVVALLKKETAAPVSGGGAS